MTYCFILKVVADVRKYGNKGRTCDVMCFCYVNVTIFLGRKGTSEQQMPHRSSALILSFDLCKIYAVYAARRQWPDAGGARPAPSSTGVNFPCDCQWKV